MQRALEESVKAWWGLLCAAYLIAHKNYLHAKPRSETADGPAPDCTNTTTVKAGLGGAPEALHESHQQYPEYCQAATMEKLPAAEREKIRATRAAAQRECIKFHAAFLQRVIEAPCAQRSAYAAWEIGSARASGRCRPWGPDATPTSNTRDSQGTAPASGQYVCPRPP